MYVRHMVNWLHARKTCGQLATCKSDIWSIGYMYRRHMVNWLHVQKTYIRTYSLHIFRRSFSTDTDTLQHPSVLCCFSSLCSVGNPPCSDMGGVCNAGQCDCFCGWTGEYCDIRGRKKIVRVAVFTCYFLFHHSLW